MVKKGRECLRVVVHVGGRVRDLILPEARTTVDSTRACRCGSAFSRTLGLSCNLGSPSIGHSISVAETHVVGREGAIDTRFA